MWGWWRPKEAGEVGGRREGHPLFRWQDEGREEENQRGKAKRGRDEKRQTKRHEKRFWGDQ